jgi:hypothetical protein
MVINYELEPERVIPPLPALARHFVVPKSGLK